MAAEAARPRYTAVATPLTQVGETRAHGRACVHGACVGSLARVFRMLRRAARSPSLGPIVSGYHPFGEPDLSTG